VSNGRHCKTFEVDSAQLEELEVSKGFGANYRWCEWLLARNSAAGQLAEVRFHDLQRGRHPGTQAELLLHHQYAPMNNAFMRELGQLVLVSVEQVQPTHGGHGRVTLRFTYDERLHDLQFEENATYILSPRFVRHSPPPRSQLLAPGLTPSLCAPRSWTRTRASSRSRSARTTARRVRSRSGS
jgi:hypothetical protein